MSFFSSFFNPNPLHNRAVPGLSTMFGAATNVKNALTGQHNHMSKQLQQQLSMQQGPMMMQNAAQGKQIIGSSADRYSVCPYCGRSG